jgi:branched-chain amino acid aminotransferase
MELKIKKADKLKPLPDASSLTFGTIFTDHMFNMDYSPEKGWHNARIEPYQPIVMEPSTMVLHYGQSIFEGLKAFKTDSGEVRLFRPQENFIRFWECGRPTRTGFSLSFARWEPIIRKGSTR